MHLQVFLIMPKINMEKMKMNLRQIKVKIKKESMTN